MSMSTQQVQGLRNYMLLKPLPDDCDYPFCILASLPKYFQLSQNMMGGKESMLLRAGGIESTKPNFKKEKKLHASVFCWSGIARRTQPLKNAVSHKNKTIIFLKENLALILIYCNDKIHDNMKARALSKM